MRCDGEYPGPDPCDLIQKSPESPQLRIQGHEDFGIGQMQSELPPCLLVTRVEWYQAPR